MSALRTPFEGSEAPGPSGPAEPPVRRVRDVLWTVVTFAVLGLVAGWLWQHVAGTPSILRTQQGAVLDQAQLGVRVQADGWFAVVGAVAGLLAGFGLVRPARRDVLLVVVLGTAASVGAAYLALWLGTRLGDVPRARILATPVGDRVDAPLQVISRMVVLAWPVGFLVAAVAVLLGGAPRPDRHDPAAADVPPPAA